MIFFSQIQKAVNFNMSCVKTGGKSSGSLKHTKALSLSLSSQKKQTHTQEKCILHLQEPVAVRFVIKKGKG